MRGTMLVVVATFVLVVVAGSLSADQGSTPTRGQATPGQRGAGTPARTSPGAGPVIVFQTVKGVFEVETYPNEAPKSVAHILELVRRNFYNGHRIHRVEPGFVVQFGDPYSRDYSRRDRWGTGGSGREIGVSEVSPKHTHRVGAVALAHAGNPKLADSQMYIALAPLPRLDKDFTVFGQVISGMSVVRQLAIGDVIRRASVRAEAPSAK